MKMRQQVQSCLKAEQDHHMRPPEHDVDFDRRKNYQLIIRDIALKRLLNTA